MPRSNRFSTWVLVVDLDAQDDVHRVRTDADRETRSEGHGAAARCRWTRRLRRACSASHGGRRSASRGSWYSLRLIGFFPGPISACGGRFVVWSSVAHDRTGASPGARIAWAPGAEHACSGVDSMSDSVAWAGRPVRAIPGVCRADPRSVRHRRMSPPTHRDDERIDGHRAPEPPIAGPTRPATRSSRGWWSAARRRR